MKLPLPITREEVANVITHGGGLIFFLIATPFLLWHSIANGQPTEVFGILIFCFSLLLVYSSSTIYHSITEKKLRKKLKIIDHICIYFLIAGTHTPLIFLYLNHFYGWLYVAGLWLMVVLGILFKVFFIDNRYQKISLTSYLVMGWSAALTLPYMWAHLSSLALWLLVAGGLFYTVGIIFFVWEKLPYNHAVWHLFVIGGSVSHYLALFYCF